MRHMRTSAPALVPIFRSALQARLLLRVLTSTQPPTAADLARELDAPEPTVSREVRRLLEAGLITGRRIGRATLLSAAEDNPATAPLRQLLVVTYGPTLLLERTLVDVAGIDAAYIHGSWAARYHGETGRPPGDVDVLIVGSPDRGDVDAALDGLERQLGREIHLTYASTERWHDPTDPYIAALRQRPLVELRLHRLDPPRGPGRHTVPGRKETDLATRFDVEERWPELFVQLEETQRRAVVQALAIAWHEGWEPNREDVVNLVDEARGAIDTAEYRRRAHAAAYRRADTAR